MPSAPDWWETRDWRSTALLPLSFFYARAGSLRRRLARPFRAPVPVICVGNAVAGGAGKTPVALWLGEIMKSRGTQAWFLSRGYGGRWTGPVQVDPAAHAAQEVGDEPLLLARVLPTLVAKDRVAGAQEAVARGAGVIVMDDGLQNPSLVKDFSLLVVDGTYGFGNGRVIPAGPLREPLSAARAKTDAVVVVGENNSIAAVFPGTPIFLARLEPVPHPALAGQRVIGFAGIGRPEKFRATLREMGCETVAFHAFPDHHPYRAPELEALAEEAKNHGAILVATAKDAVRLPPEWHRRIETVEVRLRVEREEELLNLLFARAGHVR